MLDINLIRTQPDLVKQAVTNRQEPALAATVDEILALDARRRDFLAAARFLELLRR